MKPVALLLVSVAVLGLAGCKKSVVDEPRETGAGVTIDVDAEKPDSREGAEINIEGDTETGKFELRLPGGIEANIKVPKGVADDTKFDIDGVGMYPGGKVQTLNVKALREKDSSKGSATVQIGFSAPGDAAAVADWYQQQFAEKKVVATRSGDTFTGRTEDGDEFTLAMTPEDAGTKGLLTIRDAG